jgi:hypothetical protein
MSAFTLKSARFPAGTSVGAYPRSAWGGPSTSPPEGAPSGTASETKTVGSDNSLTFTTLVDGVRYYAYANVGGENRIVGFTPGVPAVSGAGPITLANASVGLAQLNRAAARKLSLPSDVIAESYPLAQTTTVTLSGGGTPAAPRIRLAYAEVPAGATITGIEFWVGTTGGAGVARTLMGLWDLSYNLLATSALDTALTWAAQTPNRLLFTTPYVVPADMGLYGGVVVEAATTLPTFAGSSGTSSGVPMGGAMGPPLGGQSTTFTPPIATLPNPAAAMASGTAECYFRLIGTLAA